jgi:UDP-N-acetylmuramoyl-tripeptide--D-alanyl-D-alanine ligase
MSAPRVLTAGAIAQVAGGRVLSGDAGRACPRISRDTRTLERGDAFLAIVGPNHDGHDHLAAALSKGACALIVSNARAAESLTAADVPVVLVDDTVRALQDIARHVRQQSGAKVVAVVGSAGKTTTKEAIATLLSSKYRTLRNAGNLNNHIGLPLSLLELQQGADVAVVELGMNHAGEIRELVRIARPDVRVWTNVGTAHIEHFQTQDRIAEAKAEVLEDATPDTVAVVNASDARVMRHVRGFPGRVITFGPTAAADVHPLDVEDRGLAGQSAEVRTPAGELTIDLPLAGPANLENVLAAVAVAVTLGVSRPEIAAQAGLLRPAAHRGEVHQLSRDVLVYDDSYNSSPSALDRTLQLIAADRSGRRRVAFLGEMLELGAESVRLHRQCGEAAARAGVEQLVTVGGPPAAALRDAAIEAGMAAQAATHVATSDAASDLVGRVVRSGDLVLVKGSHGTRMLRVVERLQAEYA